MPASSKIKTTNQEIAAYIEFKTGRISELPCENSGDIVSIKFPSTPDVVQAAMDFGSGCPESKQLGICWRLLRRISEEGGQNGKLQP